jgi:hypothetical protein
LVSNGAQQNRFYHKRTFSTPNDKSVRQNLDTLYSVAFLDLTDGPLVLNIPATKPDQYYLLQMLDAWTNVFGNPGSRTTGHSAQKHLIVGPTGMPNEVDSSLYTSVIKSPTNLVWIIGRTSVSNGDLETVWDIQDQYNLAPLIPKTTINSSPFKPSEKEVIEKYLLSTFGDFNLILMGGREAAVKTLAPLIEKFLSKPIEEDEIPLEKDPLTPQEIVSSLSGFQFFSILSVLTCRNPPFLPQDTNALKKFEVLGFQPCRAFKPLKLPPLRSAIELASFTVTSRFKTDALTLGTFHYGWRIVVSGIGKYDTDYHTRAVVAYAMVGSNLPQDTVYPVICQTADNKSLLGEKSYSLVFSKDFLPPVDAFWSITLYDSNGYLLNEQKSHLTSTNGKTPLSYETNGSLRLIFQTVQPKDPSKEANWIPTQAQVPFCLTLRLYAPQKSILNLTWTPPPLIENANPIV